MPDNKWIRVHITKADGAVINGHAGRRGYIFPAEEGKIKFIGKTYDGLETHFADKVGDLKAMLDAVSE